jgi:integral membrane sensor domain MASE1
VGPAGLLVFGFRAWPAILTGAVLVNVTTAGSVPTSLGIAAGNTLEALAGAYLVDPFANGREGLQRAQDIVAFVFRAAILSTTVSATIGVLTWSRRSSTSASASAPRPNARPCRGARASPGGRGVGKPSR